MKYFKYLLFIVLGLFIFPSLTNAAGIAPKSKTLTVTVGKSATLKIVATSATGKVNLSVANKSIASISTKSYWADNDTKSITVKGLKEGSTVITVTLFDAGTYAGQDISGKSYKVTVNVVKATTKAPTTAKPTTTTMPTTTTTLSPFQIDDLIYLKDIGIVGYPLNFKTNTLVYDIFVDSAVTALHVNAITKDNRVLVNGAGVVDITNKDKIEIVVSFPGTQYSRLYTINIHKSDKVSASDKCLSDETIVKCESDFFDNVLFIIACLIGVILLIVVIIQRIKIKNLEEFND